MTQNISCTFSWLYFGNDEIKFRLHTLKYLKLNDIIDSERTAPSWQVTIASHAEPICYMGPSPRLFSRSRRHCFVHHVQLYSKHCTVFMGVGGDEGYQSSFNRIYTCVSVSALSISIFYLCPLYGSACTQAFLWLLSRLGKINLRPPTVCL